MWGTGGTCGIYCRETHGTALQRPRSAARVQGARCQALCRAPAATLTQGCPVVPLPLLRRCWSTNHNMGFWWILRFPVFLAILVSPHPVASPTTSPGSAVLGAVAASCSHALHGLSPPHCRSTSSSSSASSRSSSPSSAHTRCATPTTSSGGQWVQPQPCVPTCGWCGAHGHGPALWLPAPCRLAKSTLTLIPLLGIHEVIFAFITDEHAQGTLRYVKLFFDLFLSSFQVSTAGPGWPQGRRAGRDGLGAGASRCPSCLSCLCPGDAGGHSLLLRQQGGERPGWERAWGRGAVLMAATRRCRRSC